MFAPPPDPALFPFIVLDLETTGLEWLKDDAFAMALTYPGGGSYALDLREAGPLQWARDFIPRAKMLVNHNIKFDLHFLRKAGIGFPKRVIDTMVDAALIYEHHTHYTLDYLTQRYVKIHKDTSIYEKLAALFGGKADHKQMGNLHRAPREVWEPYALRDTESTLALHEWQMPELERQGLLRVHDMECELLPILFEMEHGGVRVDLEGAERAVPLMAAVAREAQARLDAVLGRSVNINSPKQLQGVFQPRQLDNGWFELIDGTLAEPTDSGKAASIDADCLKRMKHPAGPLILEIRNALKIKGTFLEGHILGSAVNGRVHTTFNQTRTDNDDGGGTEGTGSGRLSSCRPNLQQISKRNKKACELVRALFLPDEGMKWFSIDLAQIDFRVMAHYLQNHDILARYADNPLTDFHQAVADMTGLPRNPSPTSRASAKTINLGLSFGMGQGRLAEEMGLPFIAEKQPDGRVFKTAGPEALEIFNTYHRNLPGLGGKYGLLKRASDTAKSRGYIMTLMGRRCRFPGGLMSHKAGALIFQGGAADLMKKKIVEMDAVSPDLGSRMMVTVHDALDFSIPEDGAETIAKAYQEVYNSNTLGLRVPICSDYKVGNNWWEAS